MRNQPPLVNDLLGPDSDSDVEEPTGRSSDYPPLIGDLFGDDSDSGGSSAAADEPAAQLSLLLGPDSDTEESVMSASPVTTLLPSLAGGHCSPLHAPLTSPQLIGPASGMSETSLPSVRPTVIINLMDTDSDEPDSPILLDASQATRARSALPPDEPLGVGSTPPVPSNISRMLEDASESLQSVVMGPVPSYVDLAGDDLCSGDDDSMSM